MAKKRRSSDPADPKRLTVVFDFGGVLSAGHDPVPDIHALTGGELEMIGEALWEHRPAFDRGDLSSLEYWRAVTGAAGLEELTETLTWSLLGIHAKPLGLLDVEGYWGPLIALLDQIHGDDQQLETVIEVPEEAVSEMREIVESPPLTARMRLETQNITPPSSTDADDELSALSVPSPYMSGM